MALTIGAKAPEFTLYDADRNLRSLSEFRGKKVVLAFYPGAFTGACTKEMCSLRDTLSNLSSMNAQVVGISVDSPFANKAFAAQNNLSFPLLSDFTRAVARQYAGVYEDFAGVKGYVAAKRAVYILDGEGIVKYVWVTEAPAVEPNYAEISQVLGSIR
jgi:peroxiredoxin